MQNHLNLNTGGFLWRKTTVNHALSAEAIRAKQQRDMIKKFNKQKTVEKHMFKWVSTYDVKGIDQLEEEEGEQIELYRDVPRDSELAWWERWAKWIMDKQAELMANNQESEEDSSV